MSINVWTEELLSIIEELVEAAIYDSEPSETERGYQHHRALFAARSVGIELLRVRDDSYFLFSANDGHQLGYDFDDPWTADMVTDYCRKLKAVAVQGVFVP